MGKSIKFYRSENILNTVDLIHNLKYRQLKFKKDQIKQPRNMKRSWKANYWIYSTWSQTSTNNQILIVRLLILCRLRDIIGLCLAISDVILVILDVGFDNFLKWDKQSARAKFKNVFVELARSKKRWKCVRVWSIFEMLYFCSEFRQRFANNLPKNPLRVRHWADRRR